MGKLLNKPKLLRMTRNGTVKLNTFPDPRGLDTHTDFQLPHSASLEEENQDISLPSSDADKFEQSPKWHSFNPSPHVYQTQKFGYGGHNITENMDLDADFKHTYIKGTDYAAVSRSNWIDTYGGLLNTDPSASRAYNNSRYWAPHGPYRTTTQAELVETLPPVTDGLAVHMPLQGSWQSYVNIDNYGYPRHIRIWDYWSRDRNNNGTYSDLIMMKSLLAKGNNGLGSIANGRIVRRPGSGSHHHMNVDWTETENPKGNMAAKNNAMELSQGSWQTNRVGDMWATTDVDLVVCDMGKTQDKGVIDISAELDPTNDNIHHHNFDNWFSRQTNNPSGDNALKFDDLWYNIKCLADQGQAVWACGVQFNTGSLLEYFSGGFGDDKYGNGVFMEDADGWGTSDPAGFRNDGGTHDNSAGNRHPDKSPWGYTFYGYMDALDYTHESGMGQPFPYGLYGSLTSRSFVNDLWEILPNRNQHCGGSMPLQKIGMERRGDISDPSTFQQGFEDVVPTSANNQSFDYSNAAFYNDDFGYNTGGSYDWHLSSIFQDSLNPSGNSTEDVVNTVSHFKSRFKEFFNPLSNSVMLTQGHATNGKIVPLYYRTLMSHGSMNSTVGDSNQQYLPNRYSKRTVGFIYVSPSGGSAYIDLMGGAALKAANMPDGMQTQQWVKAVMGETWTEAHALEWGRELGRGRERQFFRGLLNWQLGRKAHASAIKFGSDDSFEYRWDNREGPNQVTEVNETDPSPSEYRYPHFYLGGQMWWSNISNESIMLEQPDGEFKPQYVSPWKINHPTHENPSPTSNKPYHGALYVNSGSLDQFNGNNETNHSDPSARYTSHFLNHFHFNQHNSGSVNMKRGTISFEMKTNAQEYRPEWAQMYARNNDDMGFNWMCFSPNYIESFKIGYRNLHFNTADGDGSQTRGGTYPGGPFALSWVPSIFDYVGQSFPEQSVSKPQYIVPHTFYRGNDSVQMGWDNKSRKTVPNYNNYGFITNWNHNNPNIALSISQSGVTSKYDIWTGFLDMMNDNGWENKLDDYGNGYSGRPWAGGEYGFNPGIAGGHSQTSQLSWDVPYQHMVLNGMGMFNPNLGSGARTNPTSSDYPLDEYIDQLNPNEFRRYTFSWDEDEPRPWDKNKTGVFKQYINHSLISVQNWSRKNSHKYEFSSGGQDKGKIETDFHGILLGNSIHHGSQIFNALNQLGSVDAEYKNFSLWNRSLPFNEIIQLSCGSSEDNKSFCRTRQTTEDEYTPSPAPNPNPGPLREMFFTGDPYPPYNSHTFTVPQEGMAFDYFPSPDDDIHLLDKPQKGKLQLTLGDTDNLDYPLADSVGNPKLITELWETTMSNFNKEGWDELIYSGTGSRWNAEFWEEDFDFFGASGGTKAFIMPPGSSSIFRGINPNTTSQSQFIHYKPANDTWSDTNGLSTFVAQGFSECESWPVESGLFITRTGNSWDTGLFGFDFYNNLGRAYGFEFILEGYNLSAWGYPDNAMDLQYGMFLGSYETLPSQTGWHFYSGSDSDPDNNVQENCIWDHEAGGENTHWEERLTKINPLKYKIQVNLKTEFHEGVTDYPEHPDAWSRALYVPESWYSARSFAGLEDWRSNQPGWSHGFSNEDLNTEYGWYDQAVSNEGWHFFKFPFAASANADLSAYPPDYDNWTYESVNRNLLNTGSFLNQLPNLDISEFAVYGHGYRNHLLGGMRDSDRYPIDALTDYGETPHYKVYFSESFAADWMADNVYLEDGDSPLVFFGNVGCSDPEFNDVGCSMYWAGINNGSYTNGTFLYCTHTTGDNHVNNTGVENGNYYVDLWQTYYNTIGLYNGDWPSTPSPGQWLTSVPQGFDGHDHKKYGMAIKVNFGVEDNGVGPPMTTGQLEAWPEEDIVRLPLTMEFGFRGWSFRNGRYCGYPARTFEDWSTPLGKFSVWVDDDHQFNNEPVQLSFRIYEQPDGYVSASLDNNWEMPPSWTHPNLGTEKFYYWHGLEHGNTPGTTPVMCRINLEDPETGELWKQPDVNGFLYFKFLMEPNAYYTEMMVDHQYTMPACTYYHETEYVLDQIKIYGMTRGPIEGADDDIDIPEN